MYIKIKETNFPSGRGGKISLSEPRIQIIEPENWIESWAKALHFIGKSAKKQT